MPFVSNFIVVVDRQYARAKLALLPSPDVMLSGSDNARKFF
jgi:hypothetical protein